MYKTFIFSHTLLIKFTEPARVLVEVGGIVGVGFSVMVGVGGGVYGTQWATFTALFELSW
jgi:hypothetical protein